MIALALLLLPEPISLDGITVERARAMHGKLVAASFIVAKPSFTWRDCRGGTLTVIGAADREEWCERGAVLKGNGLDIDMGKRVPVVGALRVIDHGPYVVNRVLVPAWTEIRVGQ